MGKVQGRLIVFFISFSLICIQNSCKDDLNTNSKTNNFNISNTEKREMNKILTDQLEGGCSHEYPYEYSEKDLEATIIVLKENLKNNGYTNISPDKFREKIKMIFDRTIDPNSDSEFLFVNFLDKCNRDLIFNRINPDNNGFFIIKKEFFITNFFALPEIVDYQKEFPSTNQIENKPILIKDEIEGNEIEIKRWKEVEDLPEKRSRNLKLTIEINKYLFNDNRASFAWLKTNNAGFLEILVKTFGYVEDEELTKFVLDKNLKDNEEFGKIIWNKTCEGKLHFNDEIIQVMKSSPSKYFEPIENYLRYLYNNEKDLDFSQKAEIMGKLAYYTTKIVGNESKEYYSFFPFVAGEEFQEEFKKKNYYNIKDFQNIYEETKTGGVAYPGMIE